MGPVLIEPEPQHEPRDDDDAAADAEQAGDKTAGCTGERHGNNDARDFHTWSLSDRQHGRVLHLGKRNTRIDFLHARKL